MTNTVTPEFPVNAREVAKAQKDIIYCLLAELGVTYIGLPILFGAGNLSPEVGLPIFYAVRIGMGILVATYLHRGMKHLSFSSITRVILVLLCITCCAPFVLIYVNHQFTKLLRSAGLKVGFMGVNLDEIPSKGQTKKG